MIKFDIEPLRKLYVAYHDRKRYMKLAEENERKVVEWRPATGEMISSHPFEHECFGAIFRWLAKGEKADVRQVDHGLDAQGRILIAREVFGGSASKEDLEEAQYLYEGDQITAIVGFPHREPKNFEVDNLERFIYKAGHLTRYERFYWNGALFDVYSWKGDRMEQSEFCGADHVDFYHPNRAKYGTWKGSDEVRRSQRKFEYDDQGELSRGIQYHLDDKGKPDPKSQFFFYVRPIPGVTMAKLSAEVEELLIEAIPKAVKKGKIKSPAYCLLVCYCGEDYHGGWPPFLVVGGEKWRDQIVQDGKDIKYYLWAPDEMRDKPENVEIMLADSALNGKCKMHLQLMSAKNNYGSVLKVLQNVVHKLNAMPGDRILKTTKDFIVAFVDNTAERSFKKDIKASISEKQFAELKSRGLI